MFALVYALPVSSWADLRVLTYDSLVAEGGLGAELKRAFQAKCSESLTLVSVGDSGQIPSRVRTEQRLADNRRASAVIGVDVWTFPQIEEWVEPSLNPEGLSKVRSDLRIAPGFIPFDYGWMGWMADTQTLSGKGLALPTSWNAIRDPRYKSQWIFSDPRLSTPGMFLLYTVWRVFGNEANSILKSFRGLWFSMTPGWTQAYGLFTQGKVPLAWSYGSSQAYHQKEDPNSKRFRALEFLEGQPVHVEGAVALKVKKGQGVSKSVNCLMQVLLSEEIQSKIPETQWMWPARVNTAMPASFRGIPEPKTLIFPKVNKDTSKRLFELWKETR